MKSVFRKRCFNCRSCDSSKLSDENEFYEEDDIYICKKCYRDDEVIGACEVCKEKFLIKDLQYKNGYSYCEEHIDEVELDDEERNDRESFMEYFS